MSKTEVFSALFTFLFLALSPFSAHATCSALKASADVRVKGHVFFSTGESCLTNGNEKTCVGAHEKLVDSCKSKTAVMKFGCNGDEPTMNEVNCPSGTSCSEGACQ
jgi:hypothetical protein